MAAPTWPGDDLQSARHGIGGNPWMGAMTVKFGHLSFADSTYDEQGDGLHLHVGERQAAADGEETPEGHAQRFDADENVIGLTIIESYWMGVFEPLRDPQRFAKISVEGGTIVWPEDGLDMAPEPLYDEARERRASTAPAR